MSLELLLSELLFISVNGSASFPIRSIVESDTSFKEILDALLRVPFDVKLATVVEVNVKGGEMLEMLVTVEDKLVVCGDGESEYSEYLNFRLFKNTSITVGNLILKELILRGGLVLHVKCIEKEGVLINGARWVSF